MRTRAQRKQIRADLKLVRSMERGGAGGVSVRKLYEGGQVVWGPDFGAKELAAEHEALERLKAAGVKRVKVDGI